MPLAHGKQVEQVGQESGEDHHKGYFPIDEPGHGVPLYFAHLCPAERQHHNEAEEVYPFNEGKGIVAVHKLFYHD